MTSDFSDLRSLVNTASSPVSIERSDRATAGLIYRNSGSAPVMGLPFLL